MFILVDISCSCLQKNIKYNNQQSKLMQMSCILKIAYQHKHKKYRFHKDKPMNFNQIRQQLSIHLPNHSVQYQIQNSLMPHSFKKQPVKQQTHGFYENQLVEHLQGMEFQSNQTIKIKVINKNLNDIPEEKSEHNSEEDIADAPQQIQKLRSRSDEIDLSKPIMTEISDSMEITQEFMYNSQMEFFKLPQSKQVQKIEEELAQNSRRSKIVMEKRGYTDLQKLDSYLNKIKKEEIQ